MKRLTNKGNVDSLQGFIYGIAGTAIILAIVLIILVETRTAVVDCPTGYSIYNESQNLCWNTDLNVSATPGGTNAASSLNTMVTKLGTVPTWIGILIVVFMATLVLGYFYIRR